MELRPEPRDALRVGLAVAPRVVRRQAVRLPANMALPWLEPGTVEDVVATAMFLATKDSDYFTGQTLCPAGGDVMV